MRFFSFWNKIKKNTHLNRLETHEMEKNVDHGPFKLKLGKQNDLVSVCDFKVPMPVPLKIGFLSKETFDLLTTRRKDKGFKRGDT